MASGCHRQTLSPMGRASLKNGTSVPLCLIGTNIMQTKRQYQLTRLVPSLYHCLRRCAQRFCTRQRGLKHFGGGMDSAYATWIGQPVVLQVALGEIKVPLRGTLLKDGGETVRMRIGEGWDVDIYKTMILAIEQDAMALLPA